MSSRFVRWCLVPGLLLALGVSSPLSDQALTRTTTSCARSPSSAWAWTARTATRGAAFVRASTRPELYTLQGLVHSEGLNDDAAATEAFRKASNLDPRNPARWYTLARHLQKTGTLEETRNTLQAFQQSWEQGAVGKGRTAIAPPFGRMGLLQEKARVEPFFPPVLYAEGFARLQR